MEKLEKSIAFHTSLKTTSRISETQFQSFLLSVCSFELLHLACVEQSEFDLLESCTNNSLEYC